MENSQFAWKYNSKARFSPVRTMLFAIALVWILCSLTSAPYNEKNLNHQLFTLLLICFCLITFGIIFRRVSKGVFIVVKRDSILIPRFGLKPIQLHFSKVNSIEKSETSGELHRVIVGQSENAPITIEKRIFESEIDFEECVHFISKESAQCGFQEADRCATLSTCSKRNQVGWSVDLYVIWLIAFYSLLAPNGIEMIGEDVAFKAGIVKDSLSTREYYRFFTAFSLHYTPFHLLLNAAALSIFGRRVSIIYGTVRCINIFLLSALSGAIASLFFSSYQIVLGASGGILGLMFTYFCACLKFPIRLPGSVSMSTKAVILTIILQFTFDLAVEDTDIFSHAGGAAFGLIYANTVLNLGGFSNIRKPHLIEVLVAIVLCIAYATSVVYFFGAVGN